MTINYDGQTYRSDPELLRPVPPIDKVYSSFRRIFSTGTNISGEFQAYLDVNDPGGEENYYQWDWIHYDMPKFCVIFNNSGVNYWKRCCTDCWNITRSAGQIILATDRFVDGRRLSGVPVAEVPYDDVAPYYLRIGQQSLSREAYQYWRTIQNLTTNVGSVFDIPPATLVGNLHNVVSGGPPMLGYFQVSGRTEKIVYISRFLAPVQPFAPTIFPYLTTCEPCKESLYRTGRQPEGWVR